MSSRWKLLRFLKVEHLLAPAGDKLDPEPGVSSLLTPLTSDVERANPNERNDSTLRNLASTACRAHSSYSMDGMYAFLLSRGVVEVYHLYECSLFALPEHPPDPAVAHFTIPAHEISVSALTIIPRSKPDFPVLVTAGSDARYSTLKVWTVVEVSKERESSPLLSVQVNDAFGSSVRKAMLQTAILRLSSESIPSCIATSHSSGWNPTSCTVAVGCKDGTVLVFRGDLTRDKCSRHWVAPAPGEMEVVKPVLHVVFLETNILCVTELSVVLIRTCFVSDSGNAAEGSRVAVEGSSLAPSRDLHHSTTSGVSYSRQILDSRGAPGAAAVVFVPSLQQLVVAREEALYFFNAEGRGQCLAFPSKKVEIRLAAFGTYLIHGSYPGSVIAYDIATKIIAYKGPGHVRACFTDHAEKSAILCMDDGAIIRLVETPIQDRVAMLLNRGLHAAAIALASSSSASIHNAPSKLYIYAVQKYAEHLMQRGDYDLAAEQLATTIGGSLEPSWVVSRLVEQPGLRSGLRSYLEALHMDAHVSSVFTKVLITCYRHDRARFAILQSQDKVEQEKTGDAHIVHVLSGVDWSESEVDGAIKYCCESKLYGVAESVARKRRRYVPLASTLVLHRNNIQDGLSVLKQCTQRDEAMKIALACGRKFLAESPVEFTSIILEMAEKGIFNSPLTTIKSRRHSPNMTDRTQDLRKILHLFVDYPHWMATLLESLASGQQSHVTSTGHDGSLEFTSELWKLLFDAVSWVDTQEHGSTSGRRALKLLQSRHAKVDFGAALAVSETLGNDVCIEFLHEHFRMYDELGSHLRCKRKVDGLLRASRRHGKQEPRLWLQMLRLVAPLVDQRDHKREGETHVPKVDEFSATALGEADAADLTAVFFEAINALDASGFLSPSEIIDFLGSWCPRASWSMIQPYFEKTIGKTISLAEQDEAFASSLAIESQRVHSQVASLDEPVIVQPRFCAACEDTLTLPITYFYCSHAFHTVCLMGAPSGTMQSLETYPTDHETRVPQASEIDTSRIHSAGMTENPWAELECPRCTTEVDAMLSMRRALEEKNERHDDFFRLLRSCKADEGFDTIIGYLARSPFL